MRASFDFVFSHLARQKRRIEESFGDQVADTASSTPPQLVVMKAGADLLEPGLQEALALARGTKQSLIIFNFAIFKSDGEEALAKLMYFVNQTARKL